MLIKRLKGKGRTVEPVSNLQVHSAVDSEHLDCSRKVINNKDATIPLGYKTQELTSVFDKLLANNN